MDAGAESIRHEECHSVGLSCGGYYAVRIAHTHKDQLRGSVAQGAGVHRWFERSWLDNVDGHEYPFE